MLKTNACFKKRLERLAVVTNLRYKENMYNT